MSATSRKSDDHGNGATIGAAVISLATLGLAVFLVTRIVGYSTLDAETIGTVSAQDSSRNSCSSDVTYAVDGVDRELGYGSCPGTGGLVTVRYDADDPERATADGSTRTYVAYPILVVVLVLLSGGVGYVAVRLRRGDWDSAPRGRTGRKV